MTRTLSTLVWTLVLLAPASFVRAQSDLRDIPPNAIAWWYYDPSAFAAAQGADPRRALVEGAIRTAFAAGLIDDEDSARAVAGVLAASIAGRHPHRGVLLDFRAHPEGEDFAIDTLSLVLDLRGGDHKTLLRTVRSVAVDAEKAGEGGHGTQREIELPGGRRGGAYREEQWPDWREVSWCSEPGAFSVALGAHTLDNWFNAVGGPPDAEPVWNAHRALVDSTRPAGDVFFELYISLDAFRASFPEAFAGRLGPILNRWGIGNARDIMIHARRIAPTDVENRGSSDPYDGPPLLAFDVSFSPRSRPPGDVRAFHGSADYWDGDEIGFDPPPGSYAIVFHADWPGWTLLALDTYRLTKRGFTTLKVEAKQRRWLRAEHSRLVRAATALGPWAVLSDVPEPVVAMPGLNTLFARLDRPLSQTMRDDLAYLLDSCTEGVDYDNHRDLWSAGLLPPELDPGGFLRLLSWGFAGPDEHAVLLLGWGADSVTVNREWIEEEQK